MSATTTPTSIIRQDPPPSLAQRPVGPTTPLDTAILRALDAGERLELREITAAVGGSTHKVHARIQTLVDKGLVVWERQPGGPVRGPGASTYRIAAS